MNDIVLIPKAYIITAFGMPGPQGSKRHVGNGRMIESSKKVAPWRQDVVAAARAVIGISGKPIDGPIRCTMVFTLPKPVSAPKKRRTLPDKKPDLSKLIRSTEDALTTAGAWQDDARVVEIHASKRYPGEGVNSLPSPGVRIWIESITP